MQHLDLDFKEVRCKFITYLFLSLFLATLLSAIHFYSKSKGKTRLIKKEANLLFSSSITPKGIITKDRISHALLDINRRKYLVKAKDTIILDGVKIIININDTVLQLKTSNFERIIKW